MIRGEHKRKTISLKMFALAVLMLASTACDNLIGDYEGTLTITYSASGQTQAQTFNDVSVEIERDDSDAGVITLKVGQDLCRYEAEVSGANEFSFDSMTCPASTSDGCTFTPRVSGGDGELKGQKLEFDIDGTLEVRCGSNSENATFKYSFSGTKED